MMNFLSWSLYLILIWGLNYVRNRQTILQNQHKRQRPYFYQCSKNNDHYLVNEVNKNGKAGKFIHRISQAEIDRAVIANTFLELKQQYEFKTLIINNETPETGTVKDTWLYFPTDKETVKRTLEEIGLSENAGADKYCFEVYFSPYCDEPNFPLYADIKELNYFALLLSEMDKQQKNTFDAVVEEHNAIYNITDIINIAHNINCYDCERDLYCWENVGAYFAGQEGLDIDVIGDLCHTLQV